MTRIYLHHRAVDTDESVSETAEKSWPLTARGVAAAWRQYQADLDWLHRTFGPGAILPKHHFSLRVAENEGDWIEAGLGDGRDRFNVSADIADMIDAGDRWGDIARRLA